MRLQLQQGSLEGGTGGANSSGYVGEGRRGAPGLESEARL